MELKELMELKTIVFSSIWVVFREKHTSLTSLTRIYSSFFILHSSFQSCSLL